MLYKDPALFKEHLKEFSLEEATEESVNIIVFRISYEGSPKLDLRFIVSFVDAGFSHVWQSDNESYFIANAELTKEEEDKIVNEMKKATHFPEYILSNNDTVCLNKCSISEKGLELTTIRKGI